jgi:Domain of unknown function (DUF3291)
MRDSSYHLAQFNIARILVEFDHPIMRDFVANLDPINAIAERSPGFVWRLQTDAGNATAVRPYNDNRIAINLSVWTDLESLRAFTYDGDHVAIMRRRREWFEHMTDAFIVLWWVPAGHIPPVHEAVARLEHLRQHGSTAHAFTFREPFPPPDAPSVVIDPIEDACPAGG